MFCYQVRQRLTDAIFSPDIIFLINQKPKNEHQQNGKFTFSIFIYYLLNNGKHKRRTNCWLLLYYFAIHFMVARYAFAGWRIKKVELGSFWHYTAISHFVFINFTQLHFIIDNVDLFSLYGRCIHTPIIIIMAHHIQFDLHNLIKITTHTNTYQQQIEQKNCVRWR